MNDNYQQFNSYERNDSDDENGYETNLKKSRGSQPFKLSAKRHVTYDPDEEDNDPTKL